MRSNKRKLAIGAGLAAWFLASSSFSAPAVINGGITNGSFIHNVVGSGSATVSGASATTVDIPAGSLVAVATSVRAASSVTGCADSLATHNTFTAGPAQTTGSQNVQIFYSLTAYDLPIGSNITCTWGGTSGGKSIDGIAFSGLSGFDAQAMAGGSAPGSASVTIGPSAALSTASDVAVAGIATNSSGSSEDPTYTTFANSTSLDFYRFAYKFLSSNAATSYAPTPPSGNYAGVLAAFKSSGGAPTVVCTRSLMGVGPC